MATQGEHTPLFDLYPYPADSLLRLQAEAIVARADAKWEATISSLPGGCSMNTTKHEYLFGAVHGYIEAKYAYVFQECTLSPFANHDVCTRSAHNLVHDKTSTTNADAFAALDDDLWEADDSPACTVYKPPRSLFKEGVAPMPDSVHFVAICTRDSNGGYHPDSDFLQEVLSDGSLGMKIFKDEAFAATVEAPQLAKLSNLQERYALDHAAVRLFHNRYTTSIKHPQDYNFQPTVPFRAQYTNFIRHLPIWDRLICIGVDGLTSNELGWIWLLDQCKDTLLVTFLLEYEKQEFEVNLWRQDFLEALHDNGGSQAAHKVLGLLRGQYTARLAFSEAKTIQVEQGGAIKRKHIGSKAENLISSNEAFVAATFGASSEVKQPPPSDPPKPAVPLTGFSMKEHSFEGLSQVQVDWIMDKRAAIIEGMKDSKCDYRDNVVWTKPKVSPTVLNLAT